MSKIRTVAVIGTGLCLFLSLFATPAVAGTRPPDPAGSVPGSGFPATEVKIWGACGRSSSPNKIVRSYDRFRTDTGGHFMRGGKSNLVCGHAEQEGYRHILAGHRKDWEKAALLTQTNWRDVADFAIATVLLDPDKVTYIPDERKFCYSRVIYLVNKRTGQTVGTKIPKVIVKERDKRIITAYPTKSQCRS